MKGPMQIARDIADLVSLDHDVQTVCTAELGSPLTIRLGIDENAQPQEALQPLLDIRPGSYVPSSDRTHRMVTVALALVIGKAGTTDIPGGKVLTGLDLLELIYQRIETVIEGWAKAKYAYQVAYGDSSTEITYPTYRIMWTLTVQENI